MKIWFRFSIITSLASTFCGFVSPEENLSPRTRREDDDDGGKVGRNGSPKCSEIGRRCCGFSSVSCRARSSLGGRGGVAGSTSIWVSLFE